MIPYQQQQERNDVFNYTFNKNRAAEIRPEDPFIQLGNLESKKNDQHFKIKRPVFLEQPQLELDRLEREASQKYLNQ